ncbi:hypothetical protein [Leisingera sp.]|uniref:hypothetical protein n=1 Tax=Leisingera sp. TaxID=1879318 RepID=UPI002B266FF3|nr:hypothetical protein [Leisingera sp.]
MAEKPEMPPVTVGYILEAPGRPSIEQQKLSLGLHGVTFDERGRYFWDVVKKKTTRPQSVLLKRRTLISFLHPGDTLVVAGVECLGLSEADVEWFLGEVSGRGAQIIVNGGSVVVQPETDTTEIVDRVKRFQKALHMRNYRSK